MLKTKTVGAKATPAGIEVAWVEGERTNMKLTLPGDLAAAEEHLAALTGLDDGTRYRPDPATYTGT